MNTVEMTCRCCAKLFIYPLEKPLFECPACGTMHARPQAKGLSLDALNRAARQRNKCDFTNAEKSYQHVLLDYPEEHEALWGLVLCKYGVEYVEDPVTGKRLPTVHSVRKKPMQLDSDFQQACELAPPEVRLQYECDAAYIDDAMAKIREIAETCPPFDVFICHKTTKLDSTEYTEDYNRAFKLYHMLDKQGYRVFFAPLEMEGVSAGSDYEAGIYHALDTAKVMLVVCSNIDYLQSPWVRSEYLRYLEMLDATEEKHLLPLIYASFQVEKMPKEIRLRKLQAIQMEELEARDHILQALNKYQCKPSTPISMPQTQEKMTLDYAPESDFSIELIDKGCTISSYLGNGKVVNIPPEISGKKVIGIDDSAFEGCDSITRVSIPKYVLSIGARAFKECRNLEDVSLPNRLLDIRGGAFAMCEKLTHLRLPSRVMGIGRMAFVNCLNLRKIDIPESVISIEYCAFHGCCSLHELNMPSGNLDIENDAFSACSSLTLVVKEYSDAHKYAVINHIPYRLKK